MESKKRVILVYIYMGIFMLRAFLMKDKYKKETGKIRNVRINDFGV